MILKGIFIALICSFLALLTNLAISLFRKGRIKDEPPLLELKRQGKLLFLIWLFFLILYSVLYSFFPNYLETFLNSLVNIVGHNEEIIGFFYGISFYFMLSFIYLCFYYLIDRSITPTLLEIIERSLNQKLSLDEVKTIYNVERKYQMELKGMLEGRFIIKEADSYRNSFKGSLYARLSRLIKRVLKLE